MNKFWDWMIKNRFEICFIKAIGSPIYSDEIASASTQTMIGYMIQLGCGYSCAKKAEEILNKYYRDK